MQISPKDLFLLMGLSSLIFLIAPVSLIVYIKAYSERKRKLLEEKALLKKEFEHELLKSLIEVQEQTMQNIAANLHDNIGQLLSLIVVTLSSINVPDARLLSDKISSAEELAKRSMDGIRQLAKQINGKELIRQGIAKAIAFELSYLRKAGTHQVEFENNYALKEDQSEREIILFRVFQELLNNALRHARATTICVKLFQCDSFLNMVIKDDGIGLTEDNALNENNGLGLIHIRKRVELISGRLEISSPGKGTEINIHIPYI